MKLLKNVYNTFLRNGSIILSDVSGNQIVVSDFCKKMSLSFPITGVSKKGRKITNTSVYFIVNLSLYITDFIKLLRSFHLFDDTQNSTSCIGMKKGTFRYIIDMQNETHFMTIKNKNGAIFRLCDASCMVHSCDRYDFKTVSDSIFMLDKIYGDIPSSISSLASRKWRDSLKDSGFAGMYRDERYIKLFDGNITLDEYCRNAYSGGWNYFNGKPGLIVHDGICYDVHHLFPSIFASGAPAEYKITEFIDYEAFKKYQLENSKEECYFINFSCKFCIKRGAFPFVCLHTDGGSKTNMASSVIRIPKKSFIDDDGIQHYKYVECDTTLNLTMCDNEFNVFQKLYNIYDFKFISAVFMPITKAGYYYAGKLYNEKEKYKSDGDIVRSNIAKLLNNGLIGTFARYPTSQNIYYDENMNTHSVKTKIYSETHTAIAAYVTGTARAKMAILAYINRDRFIYCDTDSLHLKKQYKAKGINISKRMGDFGIEGYFSNAIYFGKKKYIEIGDVGSRTKIALAGLPYKYSQYISDLIDFGTSDISVENFLQDELYDSAVLLKMCDRNSRLCAIPFCYSGQSIVRHYYVDGEAFQKHEIEQLKTKQNIKKMFQRKLNKVMKDVVAVIDLTKPGAYEAFCEKINNDYERDFVKKNGA